MDSSLVMEPLPNPRLQRTRFALLRAPLSRKPPLEDYRVQQTTG